MIDWMKAGGIGCVIGLILGLIIGWQLYRPGPPVHESAAPAKTQADGSLILARTPESSPAPAPHMLPPGGVEERRITVTVQPRWSAGEHPAVAGPGATPTGPTVTPVCPPVRVDLSLVRMPDQTRRVVASSPDGDVVGGVDIPLEPRPSMPRATRWAALGGYDPINRTWAARVDRDTGPFRLSLEGYQTRPAGAGIRVWAGVRW